MPSNDTNITVYTPADLLRYATGRMTAHEMHALEKAALEDPFLADAIDGYHTAADTYPQPILQNNIDRLQPESQQKETRKIVPIWRRKIVQYAAAAAFILGGGWFTYSIINQQKTTNQQEIAATSETEPAQPVSVSADSSASGDNTITKKESMPRDSQRMQQSQSNEVQRNTFANAETEQYSPADDAMKYKVPLERKAPGLMVQDSTVPARTDNATAYIDVPGKNAIREEKPAQQDAVNAAPVTSSELDNRASKVLVKRKEAVSQTQSGARNSTTQYYFKGKITDAKNNPLPYANVMINGVEIGTYTDTKGNFNFIYEDSILPVRTRSLGYESQTVQMRQGRQEQQIIMPEDEKLKESLAVTVQKPQAKQAGYQPIIIETDSLSSALPVVGLFDYNTYLLNNNRISELPQAARSIELSFEVDKRGEVKNITVEQSSGKALDAEAIRLLKEGPKWKSTKGTTGRARVKVKL